MAAERITASEHVLRARRTAALARAAIGIAGLLLLVGWPGLGSHLAFQATGFTIIAVSAIPQILAPRGASVAFEESIASIATLLIVGFGEQQVTVLSLLWLSAVACGVLARGGRAHWFGRAVLIAALIAPMVEEGRIAPQHVALCVSAIALLLTGGRLTRELSTLLERARYQADYDALTGVLSRAAFHEHLASRTETGDPLTLMLIDLDGFGVVNKLQGQAAGDALLADVGQRLAGLAGEQGLVGRLGSDEFAFVVPGRCDATLAAHVATALEDGPDGVTASMGLAYGPEHGSDSDGLVRAGDIALRLAKGRPASVAVYEGRSLSDDGPEGARGALERLIAGEGLSMVVQPIVDVRTGRPHAHEALARFGGDLAASPLHWFALAAELGRRDALELACLRAALDLLPERPAGTLLSVNLSYAVLVDRRTTALLLSRDSLDGLIVEVTEEALVNDESGLRRSIAPLRERGVALAVDDMGAGYAGLGQIAAVRPDYLKLDRSLISGIDRSPQRAALVEALVGYAARTDGHLVVEGVETVAELDVVTALGVQLVQGYLFSRPAPPWPQLAPGLGQMQGATRA